MPEAELVGPGGDIYGQRAESNAVYTAWKSAKALAPGQP